MRCDIYHYKYREEKYMENISTKALSDQELDTVTGGITQNEALSVALNAANLTKDSIDLLKKVKLDYEHGRKVYEIEFYQGGFEYEFDIDAASGAILKSKKDWD